MEHQEIKTLQDQVNSFKRSGEYARAVALLVGWIEREEAQSIKGAISVASWPYQQLAIIARKEKRYDDEIAVIERFIRLPRSGSKQSQALIDRLPKAYQLSGRTLDDNHPKFIRKALLVDTETTGLSNQDELIEIALILVRYSLISRRIVDIEAEYSGLRQPSIKIPGAATAKHGITNNDVRGKRLDEDHIRTLIASADILIAHNASYDRRMIAKLFPVVTEKSWYCTLNGINWRSKGCSERSLEYLFSYYDVIGGQRHRALNDIHMTLTLLSKIDPQAQRPFFSELLQGQPVNFSSTYDLYSGKVKVQFDDEDLPVAPKPQTFSFRQPERDTTKKGRRSPGRRRSSSRWGGCVRTALFWLVGICALFAIIVYSAG